jgi:tetratricopeptide (TPR) repeat protein
MGTFFDSIHARTEDIGAVQKALEQVAMRCDVKFLLGPALNGWISILPGGSGPDETLSGEIARNLACEVFHLAVYDDDIFYYFFYRDGKLVDRYDSCPDYFAGATDEEMEESRGHPELFQDLLPDISSLQKLEKLLATGKFTLESRRMSEFAGLFNLSNALTRYDSARRGAQKQFVHIEVQPQSADDYNKRGEARLEKKDLDRALSDFNKALELEPDFVPARENCDRVELARNERSLKFAKTHNHFVREQLKMGNLERALALANSAIELHPDYAAAYNNRGLIKQKKGNRDEALADFNKAIELSPKMSAAYVNRARIKRSNGSFDDAMADCDRAIDLKPDFAVAYNIRGELKRRKGDADGALADYNRAIELKPDSALIYCNRSMARRMKGDLEGAMADGERAIELKPGLALAYNNRGMIKKDKGDLDGALSDLEKAISLEPKTEGFRTNRDKLIQIKKSQG